MLSKPWLLLPPQLAHDIGPLLLKIHGKLRPSPPITWKSVQWKHLNFPNPFGLAGGVDKDAQSIVDWWNHGAGFVEIGTVTPKPQGPNPGKIMDRNPSELAVWNKMGFPNKGVEHTKRNLEKLTQRISPILANIGKNRDTSNEDAPSDYCYCLKQLFDLVDGFVVNISSPNTKGLRELLLPENFNSFLKPIVETHTQLCQQSEVQKPLLLKISPDMSFDQLGQVLLSSLDLGIDGWVISNTTLRRNNEGFPAEGGLSGRPLAELSKALLKQAIELLGDKKTGKLIISAGGVMTPEDVFERLALGADLVQTYSGLIYNGPSFFNQVGKAALNRSDCL